MKQFLPVGTDRQRTKQSQPAAEMAHTVTSNSPSFVDNRPKTLAQLKLRETINASSKMLAQRKLAAVLNNSPRMVAQRKLHAFMNRPVKQLQAAPEETLLQGKFEAVQRIEEEEPLQGKFATAQRVEEEELVQGKFETIQRVEEEEPLQGKFEAVQRVEEEEPLQGKFASQSPVQREQQLTTKPNNTGLPDKLKNGIEGLGVLQRAVSASATYVPQAAALNAINDLDAEIPGAEQAAAAQVLHPPGGIHTPYQANYIRNPIPMTWGYCVEEQLNPEAQNLGWSTQQVMPNARPDYYRKLGNINVFADLTTATQAGPAGNHITSKLQATAHNYHNAANWQAADITHTGQRPGGAPLPLVQTNGVVTHAHALHFQNYKAYLGGPQAAYNPDYDRVFHQYGNISSGTFTQTWDKQDRDDFVAAFTAQTDSEESDYSMSSDEENL